MVDIRDLSVCYEGSPVFEHVDLEFHPGSVNVITGLSGCGKTTLLKVLNGIIPEVREADVTGTAVFGEHDLLSEGIGEKAQYMSTVFQNPKTQFYCINSSDELAFGLENRNTPREEILSTIEHYTEILHTEDLLDRDIFAMSGGEKQLLAITAAACMDNDIYLFDEPSASLDHDAIARFREIIRILRERDKIVIIAEHRLYYLKELMNRLIVLEDGRAHTYDDRDIENRYQEISSMHDLRTMRDIRRSDLPEDRIRRIRLIGDRKTLDDGSGSILKCRDLKCSYEREILDLSLDIEPGVHFIIGENGVGKSTFVKRLCNLNKGRGRRYYDGRRFRAPYHHISAVMQDVNYQIFTESCCQELAIVQDDEEVIANCLEEVSLLGRRDVHPQLLSGGEKQRLLIAKTKAGGRPVVILDEPTSGLDRLQMQKMAEYLKQFRKEGRTVLVITHDHELIMEYPADIMEFVR